MDCDCMGWARIDGRVTDHHPDCEKFEEFRYVRCELKGGGSYLLPDNDLSILLAEIAEAGDESEWHLTIMKMTKEEYERIPEFTGH